MNEATHTIKNKVHAKSDIIRWNGSIFGIDRGSSTVRGSLARERRVGRQRGAALRRVHVRRLQVRPHGVPATQLCQSERVVGGAEQWAGVAGSPGRQLGVVVVGVVGGAVPVALHAAGQTRHPAPLFLRGRRQQQQLARAVRVQLARRHALALRHVLGVDLHAATCNTRFLWTIAKQSDCCATMWCRPPVARCQPYDSLSRRRASCTSERAAHDAHLRIHLRRAHQSKKTSFVLHTDNCFQSTRNNASSSTCHCRTSLAIRGNKCDIQSK